jgi:hypothetical protein
MAINWKSKIVLVKTEATYGTDPAPTGVLNAMLLTDVQLQPMEGEDVSRNLELPYFGAQEEVPTGLRVVISGSFELVGSGTLGVPPAWSPLLRACGVAEIVTADTSVEYVPITDNPESVGIHFHLGPSRHVILGARGTAVVTINAQGIPVCRVTMTGLFVRPADQARPTVDLTKWQRPQVASKANTPTFTIGGLPFVLRSYSLDLANAVEPRLLIGYEGILITDRNELLSATVDAVPYATYNPFQRAEDGTRQPVVIVHGNNAATRVRIEAGQTAQRRPTGFENSQNVTEWPLTFRPLPTSAGNDQWKISLK